MTEEDAKKRVIELKEFYGHLTAFCVVIPGLAALNLVTSPQHWWFIYPMLGWGMGLLAHAASVFPLFGLGSKKWEEQKLKELMAAETGPINERMLQNMLESKYQELRHSDVADPAVKKLIQRIEHLEAIVTSKDWDQVPSLKARIEEMENDPKNLSDEEIIAKLAQRVR